MVCAVKSAIARRRCRSAIWMLKGAGAAFVCTECSVNKMKTRILPSFLVAGVWLATSLLLVHGVAVTNVLNGAVGTTSQATGVLNAITGRESSVYYIVD